MSKTEWTQFEQALLDANLEEFADIPAEDAIDLTLSEEFELEGMDLLEKARRGRVPRFGKALRRALLIAAIIAALATAAMAIPAVREGIIDFFTDDKETHYEFEFDSEQLAAAPDHIKTVYKPSYIPEGYVLSSDESNPVSVGYIWEHEDKESYIDYFQCTLSVGLNVNVNAENNESQWIDLNGYRVFCVLRESTTTYCWTDNEYFFFLTCMGDFSEEEVNSIFTSIKNNVVD
jgi:hypothetical protein